MSVFIRRELYKKNIFQKLFKLKVKKNFIVEVENLLCDYENSLESLTSGTVRKIADEYKINPDRDFIEERGQLLKRLLTQAVSDGRIEMSEHKKFNRLAEILLVPDEAAKNIYRQAVKDVMDSFTKPVFDSEVFSPEDEKAMYQAAGNLGLNLKFPPDVQEKLCRYRRNWEILNGKLPVLQSDIHLQAGEVLHYVQAVKWFEERTETARVNYSGFTYSTKIIGKLRWKAGTIQPHRITRDVWKEIDEGQLFLTSQRMIFNGQHGNKVIAYSKVLNFEAYSNGVQIQKDSGKSPFLEFDQEVPVFAEILNQLIKKN